MGPSGNFRRTLQRSLETTLEGWTSQDLPQTLSHYTSAETLPKILESGKLRASRLRAMSDKDKEEIRYGHGLVQEAAETRFTQNPPAAVSTVLERLRDQAHPALAENRPGEYELYPAYASCFTTNPDYAYAWREFAEGGDGYSLVLDPKAIESFQAEEEPGHLHLLPVIYDRTEQEELIDSLLDSALTELRNWSETYPGLREALQNKTFFELRTVLTVCTLGMKREKYAQEREWRAVWTTLRNEGETPDDFVHFPLSVGSRTGLSTTLKQIVIGSDVSSTSAELADGLDTLADTDITFRASEHG